MQKVDAWLQLARARIATHIWPPQCVLCGGRGQGASVDLCGGCEADLPLNAVHCEICAEPLQGGSMNVLCGACVRHRPRFDASIVPFRYAYPMDHVVRRLKYGGAVAMGRVLGELFARHLLAQSSNALPELLIPVPLAQRRFSERGFNQAIVLAEHITRRVALPLRTDLLVRTRETLEQAGLDQRARRRNIRRAFAITRPLPAAHVAIVDDVVTTGSTVNEIARVLKRAGAKRVEVWAIARAGR